jgi:hypothetical protein
MPNISQNQSPRLGWFRTWAQRPVSLLDHPIDRWLGSKSREPGIKVRHRSARRRHPWPTLRPAI